MDNKDKKWKPRPRYMGEVLNWNKDRKFGFVRCFEDGESYFVHVGQIGDEKELTCGSIIEFEIWTNKNEPDKKFAAKVLVCELPEKKHVRY
nr:MAG TPA: hypothetical protein [Caudoviricetes sp.]